MGSGPACFLAASNKPRALMLFSAFLSIRKVAEHITNKFLSKLAPDCFDNLKMMKNIRCPILFMHGKDDKLVPQTHSEELF